MRTTAAVVLSLCALSAHALVDLPHRARGGRLWEQWDAVEPDAALESTALLFATPLNYTEEDSPTFTHRY
jgi:hypothetical protein